MPRDAFKRALVNGIEIRDQDDPQVVAELTAGLVARGRAVAV
jgi:hypothetical protein